VKAILCIPANPAFDADRLVLGKRAPSAKEQIGQGVVDRAASGAGAIYGSPGGPAGHFMQLSAGGEYGSKKHQTACLLFDFERVYLCSSQML